MPSLFDDCKMSGAAVCFLAVFLFASSSRAFHRDDFLVAPIEAKRGPAIVAPVDKFDESDQELDAPDAPDRSRRAVDVHGDPDAPGARAPVSGARVGWTMSGDPTRAQKAMVASGGWSASMVIARDGDVLESYEALEMAATFIQRLEATFGRCAVTPRGGVVRLSCGAASVTLEPWAADQPAMLRVAAFATPAWIFSHGRMKARHSAPGAAPSPVVFLRGLSATRLATRP